MEGKLDFLAIGFEGNKKTGCGIRFSFLLRNAVRSLEVF
jgi:hypothetical protein